ncbi:MAG: AAA family ATPase [bacterium]
MLKQRYLRNEITADLKEKSVFIGGPRQVGKTTLAKIIGKNFTDFSYLNWDSAEDRKAILKGQFRSGSPLIIFDEIHKYKRWKNFIIITEFILLPQTRSNRCARNLKCISGIG